VKKQKITWTKFVLFGLLAAALVMCMVAGQELPEPGEERADLKGTRTAAQKAAAGPVRGARPENPAGDAETVPVERYVSPIDFDALRAENPDIYAWLEIPDTGVQAPVCFRKGDNTFYLDHDSSRASSGSGAVFTEDYNKTDFSDPVTVIYGHNSSLDGDFACLQTEFSGLDRLRVHSRLNLYLPEKEKHYRIFAAVPFSNIHLLYYYPFSSEKVFRGFFSLVFSIRSIAAVTDTAAGPEPGDSVVILSTCLDGDSSQRFLVMAKESED